MKEKKHKNGGVILMMIFTNLEKYAYSKKCLLNNDVKPPTPPSSKVEGNFAPKKLPGYGCYRRPTCTHSKQGLWLAGKTIGMVT